MRLALTQIHLGGTTILLVEQNTALALSVATRGYVLQNGHVILEQATQALLSNETVREVYLGA
ncbi:MAG: hypothetical protein WBX25_25045 [Rhodomicrobium sp.]